MRRAMPTATRSRDMVLAHFREIAAATDVPVNADFENGYAHDPAGVAENVTRCIGPASPDCRSRIAPATTPIRSTISTLALARVKAARAAIDKAGGDVVFTARTEGFIRGRPDMTRPSAG